MKRNNHPVAICLLSGGLDSAVAAAIAKKIGYRIIILFFRYGQKTMKKEEMCVDQLVDFIKPHEVWKIDLPWVKKIGGSALLDSGVKLVQKNEILEYVPFRNSIFLSVATALCEAKGGEAIFIGSTGGDRICPDNSRQYLKSFQRVIDIGTMVKKNIEIIAPLANTNKVGAVKRGFQLQVPFKLTWSCHNNSIKACGMCSNCRSRIKAFKAAGKSDPILYQ